MNTFSSPINLPDFSDLKIDFDIIDSHHHLFNLKEVYYPWLTDQPEKNFLLGNYDQIKQNYCHKNYFSDMGSLPVVKTVHVEAEADHDSPINETKWLSNLRKQYGIPTAIVAHAWFNRKNSEETLAAQACFKEVRGIRSKPVTAISAGTRDSVSGKVGSMSDPKWRAGLRLLKRYNFSWDLRVPYWHLCDAADVCLLHPDLPIVLEHTGLPWDRTKEGIQQWRVGMWELAKLPNVFLKISELGLPDSPWDYIENRMIVREAIEMFGFSRSMFASNFPVASLRIGFVDQVKAIASMVSDCSSDERKQLFFETAKKFYRL